MALRLTIGQVAKTSGVAALLVVTAGRCHRRAHAMAAVAGGRDA